MAATSDWQQAKPDVVGSQYRHVINYGHEIKVGYSKKLGFPENSDQRNNLAKIVCRLLRTQIPKGIIEIEVFIRHRPNGTQIPYREEKVLAMYEDDYDMFGTVSTDKIMVKFMEVLYNTSDFDKAMAVVNGSTGCVFVGKTYDELVEQCKTLKVYHPEDKVRRLYTGICRKYGWGDYATDNSTMQPMPEKPATVAKPGVYSMADLLQNFQMNQ